MNSHPTSLPLQRRKKNSNNNRKKNHQRTLKKPKRTQKQIFALKNRQRLAGQKNSVLKSPSFNSSESLFSKPQLCHARLGTPDVTTAQAIAPVGRHCNQITKISSKRFPNVAASLFHNILCFNFI